MNERQWLTSRNATTMLKHLYYLAGPRKLRLFICACCRRVPGMLEQGTVRAALGAAEQFADGLVPNRDRSYHEAELWKVEGTLSDAAYHLIRCCLCRGNRIEGNFAADCLTHCLAQEAEFDDDTARRVPCDILRELFGNPFHPPALPKRLPPTLTALASAVYDGGDGRFALLDAGLDELAAHFEPDWHPKGCWALDAILKKK